jgi:large subunit ribosomal protein L33
MAKAKKTIVGLKCEECKEVNYTVFKPKLMQDKLELKKHCPKCGKHTKHKETKAA